jgi:hypothetical protein
MPLEGRAAGRPTCCPVDGARARVTRPRDNRHFDRRTDAPTSGDLAFALPDVVPPDAPDITVRAGTDDPDAKMYDWTSAGGELAGVGCESARPLLSPLP